MVTSKSKTACRIPNSWVALAALALLGACSTLTAQECASADWYRLGYRDGDVYGMQAQIDQYAEQCRAADRKAYMAGWVDGNAEFRGRMEKFETQ